MCKGSSAGSDVNIGIILDSDIGSDVDSGSPVGPDLDLGVDSEATLDPWKPECRCSSQSLEVGG